MKPTKESKQIEAVMSTPKTALGRGRWARLGSDVLQVKLPLENAYTSGHETLVVNHFPASNSFTMLVLMGRNVARLETWMQAGHTQRQLPNLPANHLPINQEYLGPHLHPWQPNLPYPTSTLPIAVHIEAKPYTLNEALTLFCSECAILLESVDIEEIMKDSLFS